MSLKTRYFLDKSLKPREYEWSCAKRDFNDFFFIRESGDLRIKGIALSGIITSSLPGIGNYFSNYSRE